ncbi:MAG TPA: hypothetical protein VFR58_18810 [Flavisolibacter sp.]|nr:hypothetical protein [Flavisolibacter sp.]
MKSMLLTLLTCLALTVAAKAQQANGRLDIQLNKRLLQPGDSLEVRVDYKDTSGKLLAQSLATLQLIIEHEKGQQTRLRWPVINGRASGTLHLPDSLPLGKYTLLAGLQRNFFELAGKIQDGRNIGSIQAMLLTKTGDWDEQTISVSTDGRFVIDNWLFEDNALIAFSRTGNNKQPLDIRVTTQLDSSYQPLAVAGLAFYVGNPPAAVDAILDRPVEAAEAFFADRGLELPAVIVKTTAKTRAEQFDEEYASGLFQSANARLISIMDDPSALGFSNIFSFLQGRVAGLQIASAGFNGAAALWRGNPVTFFMDEMRVSPQLLANIPMADIAIVKAFPPPFFGAPGGNGGAIAIYTRRGGESSYLPVNRQVFRVRGYTPSSTVLNMNKLVI